MSENKQLTDVFDALFRSEGSEIYLRPANLYIKPGATIDLYTVLEAARRRPESAEGPPGHVCRSRPCDRSGGGLRVKPAGRVARPPAAESIETCP